MSKKKVSGFLIAALLIVLLYPFKTTVVPAWRLRVLDESGSPVGSMAVNYSWQHYGIEWSGRTEQSETDADGYVSFPERTTRASIIQRAFVMLMNVLSLPHSSFNKSGHIVVWGEPDKYEVGSAYYREEKPLPAQVILEQKR